MVYVHNKTTKVTTVGYADSSNINKQTFNSVVLLPGINEIAEEKLKNIENHPHFKQRVSIGEICVLNAKSDKNNKNSDELINLIPQIFDTKLLRKIIKEEKKQDIVDLAKGQLEKILTAGDKKQESTGDHFN